MCCSASRRTRKRDGLARQVPHRPKGRAWRDGTRLPRTPPRAERAGRDQDLREDVSYDEEAVQRFQREAQAAVRLKSEHVARIQDVGTFEDGTPYMVMEFLAGVDLGSMVDEHGAMPVATRSI